MCKNWTMYSSVGAILIKKEMVKLQTILLKFKLDFTS